jgi:hypothetical protein
MLIDLHILCETSAQTDAMGKLKASIHYWHGQVLIPAVLLSYFLISNINLLFYYLMRYLMKHFDLFTIMLIFVAYISLNAQNEMKEKILVGKQPLAIYLDENTQLLNILCGGKDANFNSKLDSALGDEPPSLWVFPRNGFKILSLMNFDYTATKVHDFEFNYIGFPFRPAIIDDKFFIGHLGRVRCFKLSTGELLQDTVVNFPVSAISAKDNKLFLSVRPNNGNGYINVYDYINKKSIDTIPAFINVQQTLPFTFSSKQYLAIINEGSYQKNNAKLQIIDISGEKHKLISTIDIGDGANHISLGDNKLAITLNGSNKVKIISMNTFNIINEFDVNSPRESQFDLRERNILYITTYEGSLYTANLSTNECKPTHLIGSYSEGMFNMGSDFLLVTNTFVNGSYDLDSIVSVFRRLTSVNEFENNGLVNIYPNPATDYINFELNSASDINKIAIISSFGSLIREIPLGNNTGESYKINLSIEKFGLSSGFYFMRIGIGKEIKVIPFGVIR